MEFKSENKLLSSWLSLVISFLTEPCVQCFKSSITPYRKKSKNRSTCQRGTDRAARAGSAFTLIPTHMYARGQTPILTQQTGCAWGTGDGVSVFMCATEESQGSQMILCDSTWSRTGGELLFPSRESADWWNSALAFHLSSVIPAGVTALILT